MVLELFGVRSSSEHWSRKMGPQYCYIHDGFAAITFLVLLRRSQIFGQFINNINAIDPLCWWLSTRNVTWDSSARVIQ
ncbi:hypothetical protein J6590_009940 [Homalodisca vitripennis]|nr:hypothetical protein J6590_009940 [Homalodisca vitripennis]